MHAQDLSLRLLSKVPCAHPYPKPRSYSGVSVNCCQGLLGLLSSPAQFQRTPYCRFPSLAAARNVLTWAGEPHPGGASQPGREQKQRKTEQASTIYGGSGRREIRGPKRKTSDPAGQTGSVACLSRASPHWCHREPFLRLKAAPITPAPDNLLPSLLGSQSRTNGGREGWLLLPSEVPRGEKEGACPSRLSPPHLLVRSLTLCRSSPRPRVGQKRQNRPRQPPTGGAKPGHEAEAARDEGGREGVARVRHSLRPQKGQVWHLEWVLVRAERFPFRFSLTFSRFLLRCPSPATGVTKVLNCTVILPALPQSKPYRTQWDILLRKHAGGGEEVIEVWTPRERDTFTQRIVNRAIQNFTPPISFCKLGTGGEQPSTPYLKL